MLNIQYLPFRQIESLSSSQRVNTILSIIKNGRVVIIDGRLRTVDEASLIRETMSSINDDFNGVEIAVLHDHKKHGIISKLKHGISRMLIGDRGGVTIIGPAKIISELRQNPENVELHFSKDFLKEHYNAKISPPKNVEEE